MLGFGSRGWTDDRWIGVVLADIDRDYDGEIRLLHGGCPRGADPMCGAAANTLGWRVKAMPAAWDRLGRRAGPARNREMSELLFDRREQGHDVTARGFSSSWPKLTPGSANMAELLDAAHIPYRLYGPAGEADTRHEESAPERGIEPRST